MHHRRKGAFPGCHTLRFRRGVMIDSFLGSSAAPGIHADFAWTVHGSKWLRPRSKLGAGQGSYSTSSLTKVILRHGFSAHR